jgi:hypothetical protein
VLTDKGEKLKEKAKDIPVEITKCINLNEQDGKELYSILHKLLGQFKI